MSLLLIPILAACAASPMGGAAPSSRVGPELFATAALAPSDTDIFVHVQDASALRRLLERRSTGGALGGMLERMEVLEAWTTFAEELRSTAVARGAQRWDAEASPLPDEGQLFDLLLGRELTLASRRERGLAPQEWVLISQVDRQTVAPLLSGLPHRVDGLGWRTLMAHELAYLFEDDLLLLAPAGRQGLADEVRRLQTLGGERLSGTAALGHLRTLWSAPSAGPLIEVFLKEPSAKATVRPSLVSGVSAGTQNGIQSAVLSGMQSGDAGWSAFLAQVGSTGRIRFWHHSSTPDGSVGGVLGSALSLQPLSALDSLATLSSRCETGQPFGMAMVRAFAEPKDASQQLALCHGPSRGPYVDQMRPDEGAGRHAGGAHGAAGASEREREGPGGGAGLLHEVRDGERSVEAQHAALAARLRRLQGASQAAAGSAVGSATGTAEARSEVIRRVTLGLPGDFPRSDRSADAAREGREASRRGRGLEESGVDSSPVVTRVIHRAGAELWLVGVGREFVDLLAEEVSRPSSADFELSRQISSAGVMPGALLVELLGAPVGPSEWSLAMRSLVGTLERVEWRVARPEGGQPTLEGVAQLPAPALATIK